MEQAIQLFGYLVLTLLSFIAPVVAILLSIFSEGILKLTEQYKNEESKSENNIKEQLKKQGSAENTDLVEIKKSIKDLESIKKIAQKKLSLLNPRKQILILFILLLLSFFGVVSFLITLSFYRIVELLISLICSGYAVFLLWKLLGIIIEAKKAVDDVKKDTDTKIVELLSKLVEKFEKGALSFLKNVVIEMNDIEIKEEDKSQIKIRTNEKQEIKIAILNRESRMAKNIEIGFIFSLDFIIEKINAYNLYIDKKQQIVRYNIDSIHGNTNQALSSITIIPLKEGEHKVKAFIKAENIESMYRDVILQVD